MSKILILTPHYYGIGGAETFTQALIKEAQKENEVTLCALNYRRIWKGTNVLKLFTVFPTLFVKSLVMVLKTKPDIIHAQGLIAGFVGLVLKKIFKVKLYITLLALYNFNERARWFQWLSDLLFNNCDLIFVEGENGATDIPSSVPTGKTRIFNHWVDQSVFYPPWTRDNTRIRILFVGRPIPEKGKHIVEEAERLLNDKHKYEFIYVGNIPYNLLSYFYKIAHICIVPSLYPEGYSRVVAEASSCGCALLTSDFGSLPDMVKDFGWSCRPEDIKNQLYTLVSTGHYRDLQQLSISYSKKNFSSKNAEVFTNEYSRG